MASARLERGSGMHVSPRVRPVLDRWVVDGEGPVDLGGEGPRIGLTLDVAEGVTWVDATYVDAVLAGGGRAIGLPPGGVASLDGLVITGGHFDIHPRHYGQGVDGRLDRVEEARTRHELALARWARDHGVPTLGICGGMQVMAVACGGTLVQDLPPDPPHEQPTDPATPWHTVVFDDGWGLFEPVERVNSTHHQAVHGLGPGDRVIGRSPDGVIEALVAEAHPWWLGVQWHPERMGDFRPYQALVQAIRARPYRPGRVLPPAGR